MKFSDEKKPGRKENSIHDGFKNLWWRITVEINKSFSTTVKLMDFKASYVGSVIEICLPSLNEKCGDA